MIGRFRERPKTIKPAADSVSHLNASWREAVQTRGKRAWLVHKGRPKSHNADGQRCDQEMLDQLDAVGDQLTVVIGTLDLLERLFQQQVADIQQAAEAIVRLMRPLSSHAARCSGLSTVTCNALTIQTIATLIPIVGDRVQLELRLEPAVWSCTVDPLRLGQVVINLITNAVNAMPNGGRLTIRTANVVECSSRVIRSGRYVVLQIANSRSGTDATLGVQGFDAFLPINGNHETKVGVGLALVDRVVTETGGHLFLAGIPEVETTVTVYLPASHDRRPIACRETRTEEEERGTQLVSVLNGRNIEHQDQRWEINVYSILYTLLGTDLGIALLGVASRTVRVRLIRPLTAYSPDEIVAALQEWVRCQKCRDGEMLEL